MQIMIKNYIVDDTVFVHVDGQRISTRLHKFGSLVGDGCRIGANAVLSSGTLLKAQTIVKRLELVEQDPLEGNIIEHGNR